MVQMEWYIYKKMGLIINLVKYYFEFDISITKVMFSRIL